MDATIANTFIMHLRIRKIHRTTYNRSLSDEEIIATFDPSVEGTIMDLAPEHYEKGVPSYLIFTKSYMQCPALFEGIKALSITLKDK